jgi:hypothetical protein
VGENVFMAAEDFLPTSFALSGASSSSATSVLTFLAEAGTSTSFSDSRFTLLSGIAFAATNSVRLIKLTLTFEAFYLDPFSTGLGSYRIHRLSKYVSFKKDTCFYGTYVGAQI